MSAAAWIKRIVISLLVGLGVGAAISEITFYFLQESARPPRDVLLVIPAGTADLVAQGQEPPKIPNTMAFVVGDTLIVRNDDSVDHQLGPLWIPPGTSASLELASVTSYAFQCSFRPGKYMGLDVHEPLTWGTRLNGILSAGLPLAILLALYSLLIGPRSSRRGAS